MSILLFSQKIEPRGSILNLFYYHPSQLGMYLTKAHNKHLQ